MKRGDLFFCVAEGALPAVDERGAHAEGFGADAIEGVVGDEEDISAGAPIQRLDIQGERLSPLL